MHNDERIFITNDKYDGKIHETDKKILDSVKTGEGTIAIKSREQLFELARSAQHLYNHFGVIIEPILTEERAREIKRLRITEKYSWRALAAECHSKWPNATWQPPSNQLAGMQLCAIAAKLLNIPID